MFTEIEKTEMLKGSINGLRNDIFSVYDYEEAELQELLCRFFMKINECVNVSNKALEIMKWLELQGLPQEVNKIFEKWLGDGTIDNIINVTKYNQLKQELIQEINNVRTYISSADIYGGEF